MTEAFDIGVAEGVKTAAMIEIEKLAISTTLKGRVFEARGLVGGFKSPAQRAAHMALAAAHVKPYGASMQSHMSQFQAGANALRQERGLPAMEGIMGGTLKTVPATTVSTIG